MADRIQNRRDTKARWEQYNPILLEGEIGIVTDDPNLYKVGNGVDAWNTLPYRGFNGTVTSEITNEENTVPSNAAVNDLIDKIKLSSFIKIGYYWNGTDFIKHSTNRYASGKISVKKGDVIISEGNFLQNIYSENSEVIYTNPSLPYQNNGIVFINKEQDIVITYYGLEDWTNDNIDNTISLYVIRNNKFLSTYYSEQYHNLYNVFAFNFITAGKYWNGKELESHSRFAAGKISVKQGDIIHISNHFSTAELYKQDDTVGDIIFYKRENIGEALFTVNSDGELYITLYSQQVMPNNLNNVTFIKLGDNALKKLINQALINAKDGVEIKENISTTTYNKSKGKKVLWLGTSIPAGINANNYPQLSCNNLGLICKNNAEGASCINTGNIKSLSETISEKEQYFSSEMTEDQKEVIRGYSYEKRLLPYIDGTDEFQADAIVFDHGFNDSGNIELLLENENLIDWNSLDRSNFVGAFNFLISEIYKHNPDIRIIICGHNCYYDIGEGNSSNWIHNKSVCIMQEKISLHYGFPLMKIWQYSGFNAHYIPDSSNFLNEYNQEHNTNYKQRWSDEQGNINVWQYYCPDGVHPRTIQGIKRLTDIVTKLLRELIV